MSEAADAPSTLRERSKYALIPVLAIVLGSVLYQNFQPAPQPLPPPPGRPQAVGEPSPPNAVAGSPIAWPVMSLEEIVAFDPFAPPPVAAPNAVGVAGPATADVPTAQAAGELAEPRPQAKPCAGKVQAIYRVGGRMAALVDSRAVKAGDILEGRRVLEVTVGGVLLAEQE